MGRFPTVFWGLFSGRLRGTVGGSAENEASGRPCQIGALAQESKPAAGQNRARRLALTRADLNEGTSTRRQKMCNFGAEAPIGLQPIGPSSQAQNWVEFRHFGGQTVDSA